MALLFPLVARTILLNVDLVSSAARGLVSCGKRIDSRGAGIFYLTAGCLSTVVWLASWMIALSFFTPITPIGLIEASPAPVAVATHRFAPSRTRNFCKYQPFRVPSGLVFFVSCPRSC